MSAKRKAKTRVKSPAKGSTLEDRVARLENEIKATYWSEAGRFKLIVEECIQRINVLDNRVAKFECLEERLLKLAAGEKDEGPYDLTYSDMRSWNESMAKAQEIIAKLEPYIESTKAAPDKAEAKVDPRPPVTDLVIPQSPLGPKPKRK